MNEIDLYVLVAAPFVLLVFILYLVYYFFSTNPNKFWDDWADKTLWIWLPFYALQRLIREVILKKK